MFAFANGEANRGRELMVFDWDKAAKIIKDQGAEEARAGLRGDWEWTGGDILKNGKPVPGDETYVYLASTWACPELEINDEIIACYRMQSETPNWDAGTYWPDSALKCLKEKI
jgi:hypothetical protein